MLSDGFWRFIRFGAVGLVLLAMAAGLVLGDDWLWAAAEWSAPARWSPEAKGYGPLLTGLLVVAGLVKAWLLWLILRTPLPGALDRREAWLRRLLYLAVATTLLPLWWLLPDVARAAFQLVLWPAISVLYLLVIRWRSRGLRVTAAAVFALELVHWVNSLLDELHLTEIGPRPIMELLSAYGGVIATLVVVAGLRADGRWSRGTLAFGWAYAAAHLLIFPVDALVPGEPMDHFLMSSVILNAAWLTGLVWIAAIARELPLKPRAPQPSRVPERQAL